MPRSPLTEQYQRVMSLVEQLHALEADERNFILDLLVPESEPVKKSQKKSSKKDGEKRNIQKCDIDGCSLTERAAIHKDAMLRGFHAFLAPVEKSAGGGGRRQSRREVSLRQQIGSVVQGSGNNLDGGVSKMRCAMGNCGEYADSNVHHLTTDPDFHEFQPAEQAAASGGGG